MFSSKYVQLRIALQKSHPFMLSVSFHNAVALQQMHSKGRHLTCSILLEMSSGVMWGHYLKIILGKPLLLYKRYIRTFAECYRHAQDVLLLIETIFTKCSKFSNSCFDLIHMFYFVSSLAILFPGILLLKKLFGFCNISIHFYITY